jgi:hypothetical protein
MGILKRVLDSKALVEIFRMKEGTNKIMKKIRTTQ